MNDPHDLQRFLDAQDRAYAGVLAELTRGRKSGHWIWYIFPQIAGLGSSHMSRRFAISSLDEARDFAGHPVLGARIRECTSLVMAVDGKSAEQIFGHLDAMKFRSCLTLFASACDDDPVFQDALGRFFGGARDPLTMQALQRD